MMWHPFFNACAASLYITLVVLGLRWLESFRSNTPDTMADAIGALSLLTLSVAIMAFLFFYQPVVLIANKKPAEAMTYFLTTLGLFGIIIMTILILASI
jgi:hypothetical protein